MNRVTKTIKHIIGALILIVMGVAIFGVTVYVVGVGLAVIIWGSAVVGSSVIMYALYLITE